MTMDEPRQFALIYCRVSSVKQEDVGDGLGSQEHRCREYADARNYMVEEIFTDVKTAAGDFFDRKGMKALLQYLKDNRRKKYVVIFDDLKRFARETEFHIRLRKEWPSIRPVPNASISSSKTRLKASSLKL